MKEKFDFNSKAARIIFLSLALVCAVLILSFGFLMADDVQIDIMDNDWGQPIIYGAADMMQNGMGTGHILDPDAEVRGVWIATVNNINFPSKKGLGANALKSELDAIIKTSRDNGINAIYFQVRPSSDALYNSEIFPTSEYLSGTQGKKADEDFDVLEYLVKNAHENGIKVHAWVNPLRVTYGTRENPAHDTSKLASTNPARMHPEYTVAYADGKLYYNAGLEEVRALVADGVREIVLGYDVDGIIFDDYFYPYTVYNSDGTKAAFDDSEAYKMYGNGMSLEDFRRDSINKLVKECYDTVKECDSDMLFGVSPFGIWQNNDGKNGGSDTSGLEAYHELYCDALAWIEGGYVDYISPQIYWDFTNSAARYDTLVRWWNAACDGTGVDLIVSHGVYKYAEGWEDIDNEIKNQIGFARSEMTYRGSILYGYDVIKNNVNFISDELKDVFSEEIVYSSAQSNGSGVSFQSPADSSTLASLESTYVLGSSDPAYPLYYGNEKISRTKSGYFSYILELEKGKNELVFTQNGEDYVYTVYNGNSKSEASTGGAVSYKIMEDYEIIPITPTSDIFVNSSETITVSVKAPSGSKVTCTLGSESIGLTAAENSPGTDKLYEMTYTAKLTLPSADTDKILDLGELVISAKKGEERAQITLGTVRVLKDKAVIPIEVINERTSLKTATDSYYYDDFTPQAKGMRDNAYRLIDGYYYLRVGGYVAAENVKELNEEVPIAKVADATVKNDGKYTKIYIDSDVNIPMNGRVEDGYFILNLYNVDTKSPITPKLSENPLFDKVETQVSSKANSLRYHLKLKDEFDFFGFEFAYEDGKSIVMLRNPMALAKGDKKLEGKTIILDAGHGGRDSGAAGPAGDFDEAAINLNITLATEKMLEELGATVILTRSDDEYYLLADRMNFAEENAPDMLISIHQNSMDYTVDVTKIRGLMALYWEYSGKSLAQTLAESMSSALYRYNRGASTQRLAMVRCERYPSTLIEVGFMTNVEEYERICSKEGVDAAARSICDGIIKYYERQSK